MHRQSIAARTSFIAFLLAALVAGGAVALTRLGIWDVGRGYRLMTGAALIDLAAFGAGIIWLALALKRNRGDGRRMGLIGFVGASLLLYSPALFAWRSLTMPAIADASSDPEHPPDFIAPGPADPPNPNPTIVYRGQSLTVSSVLRDYYSEITAEDRTTFLLPGKTPPTVALFWRGFEAVKAMGWNIVSYDVNQGHIEAVATSLWFGRKSDIAIRVRPAGTIGARLDIRCRSRDAMPDAGSAILCARDYLRKFAKP